MPPSTQSISVTIQSRTSNNYLIDQISISLTATVGTASLTTSVDNPKVHSSTTFNLNCVTNKPLTVIKVTIPSEMSFNPGQPSCLKDSSNSVCSYSTPILEFTIA